MNEHVVLADCYEESAADGEVLERPAVDVDERGGATRVWTDVVPDEDGEIHLGEPYIYQDLVGDQARPGT